MYRNWHEDQNPRSCMAWHSWTKVKATNPHSFTTASNSVVFTGYHGIFALITMEQLPRVYLVDPVSNIGRCHSLYLEMPYEYGVLVMRSYTRYINEWKAYQRLRVEQVFANLSISRICCQVIHQHVTYQFHHVPSADWHLLCGLQFSGTSNNVTWFREYYIKVLDMK